MRRSEFMAARIGRRVAEELGEFLGIGEVTAQACRAVARFSQHCRRPRSRAGNRPRNAPTARRARLRGSDTPSARTVQCVASDLTTVRAGWRHHRSPSSLVRAIVASRDNVVRTPDSVVGHCLRMLFHASRKNTPSASTYNGPRPHRVAATVPIRSSSGRLPSPCGRG